MRQGSLLQSATKGDLIVTKLDLKKNKIDLEYQAEMQKANLLLTLSTIALIGFVATMIVQKEYIMAASVGFVIFAVARILYKKTNKKMKEILDQLDDLKI